MSGPVHADVPWERLADFEWTEKALDLLESGRLHADVQFLDGILSTRVYGECPRCTGTLDDRQVHTAVANVWGGPGRGQTGDEPSVLTVDVTCGCGRTHKDASTGITGCGVSFRIELEGTPDAGTGATP
jgi:hypothetical protein